MQGQQSFKLEFTAIQLQDNKSPTVLKHYILHANNYYPPVALRLEPEPVLVLLIALRARHPKLAQEFSLAQDIFFRAIF